MLFYEVDWWLFLQMFWICSLFFGFGLYCGLDSEVKQEDHTDRG